MTSGAAAGSTRMGSPRRSGRIGPGISAEWLLAARGVPKSVEVENALKIEIPETMLRNSVFPRINFTAKVAQRSDGRAKFDAKIDDPDVSTKA
ncbi:MAG: hypothetical protein IIA68_05355 [Proteobacteria bacterium]|nr:hypothetical protein [Pseudomonadota bacterium]